MSQLGKPCGGRRILYHKNMLFIIDLYRLDELAPYMHLPLLDFQIFLWRKSK